MIFEDELDLLGFNEEANDDNQATVKQFRERQYFELENFTERFRLTREQVQQLVDEIGDLIGPNGHMARNHPLSALDKVLLALRFYASGSFYYVIGDTAGPSKHSVRNAISQVTRATNVRLFQQTVRFPDDMNPTRQEFYRIAQMPLVFGCIDGTLINITKPQRYPEQFLDRHGDFSLNVMVVCGPQRKIFYAKTAAPGHQHDARVFSESLLCQRLEDGWRPLPQGVLLGNSGYALRDFLQTPIPNPLTPAENRYNAAHKRTRSRIECAIGQLKNSWRCLSKLRVKDPAYAAEIIKAVIVLHNRRMDQNPEDLPAPEEEQEDQCPPEEMGTTEARAAGKQKQNELINFFVR
ncbi:DDE superfamily endonuclease domain-containing protein [Ditylenchus destructor]|uniref:DDE superfamily endonuclease domain-containing protein n=1 Tax=Ditylenchus destructor TaxID=166010 RepID=A0AAD4R1M3_9BILA|nr:DDE superfamily endonuclease domain-containing protein [Ditylenchus destructor]